MRLRARFAGSAVLLLIAATTMGGEYTFTHLAGSVSGAGSDDAVSSTAARFYQPSGVATDSSGNIFVADSGNHTIRKIAASGEVTTIAGLAGVPGAVNGRGAAARFNGPSAIAVDAGGNLYVADSGNHTIRKIAATGQVTTFAGQFGSRSYGDGPLYTARFNYPSGVAIGPDGTIYVSEAGNHDIRAISAGTVTTFAGLAQYSGWVDANGTSARFNTPAGLSVSSDGTVYVADYGNNRVRKITPLRDVSTVTYLTDVQAIIVGASGFFAASDRSVWKIDGGGAASLLAGNNGYSGDTDGLGVNARFNTTADLALDASGHVIVVDSGTHLIRSIDPVTTNVTTIAGTNGLLGSVDDQGTAAKFHWPAGMVADGAGNLYVCDGANYTIRKIAADATVTTLAGSPGNYGFVDGTGGTARFYAPWGIAFDPVTATLYVTDSSNDAIRAVTTAGAVTTFAGGSRGSTDGIGTAAKFYAPMGIVYDGNDHLLVCDNGNRTIRRIDIATRAVTTVAGMAGQSGSVDANGTAARFSSPIGLAIDSTGNLYVADSFNQTIRKITPAYDVATFAGATGQWGSTDGLGSAARFGTPWGIAYDPASASLFVVDNGNKVIRQVTLAGAVTTAAGAVQIQGETDGTGGSARFTLPTGVTADSTGSVFVSDAGSIKRGVPALSDRAAVAGSSTLPGILRDLFVANQSATTFQWSIVRKPTGSTASLVASASANPSLTPDLADTWTVRLTAATGAASSISTVDVTALCSIPTPAVSAGGPTSFCSGGSVTLTATPAMSYLWSNAATTQSITVSSSGSYTVTTSDGTGCAATSAPVTVTVVPLPSVTISRAASYCVGAGTTTASVSDAGSGASYSWSVDNGTPAGSQTSRYFSFTPDAPGPVTLHVTVTNSAGCANSGNDTAQAYALPSAAITTDSLVCSGRDNVASVPDAGPGAVYSWWTNTSAATITSGASSRQVHFTPTSVMPVDLYISVTDVHSCGASSSAHVDVWTGTPPAITVSVGEICPGGSAGASVPASYSSYAWSIANGTLTSASDGPSVTFQAGATGTVKLTVIVDGLQCSAIDAYVANCNPDPVVSLSSRSIDGTNTLMWRNPIANGYASTTIVFRTDGRYPANETDGTAFPEATGTLGAAGTLTHPSLVNGTLYRYAAFTRSAAGNYSAAVTVPGRPLDTSGAVKWAYNTGASATTAPGLSAPDGRAFVVSNDRVYHGVQTGPAGGLWPSGWLPIAMNAPSQSRTLPLQLPVNGVTRLVSLVGSQDGHVYCVDALTGTIIWMSDLLGPAVQGSPGAISAAYGAPFSLVFAASRDAANGSKVYGINPDNGKVVWTFDNSSGMQGGDGLPIGVINDSIIFEYSEYMMGSRRAYFASRKAPLGSQNTLWCISFDAYSARKLWAREAGDIDGFPYPSGSSLYVGTVAGDVAAYDRSYGWIQWSSPVANADWPIKTTVWRDSNNNQLYFSGTSYVWAVGPDGSLRWKLPINSPSTPNLYRNRLYVGSGDGRLYEISNLAVTDPAQLQVKSVILSDTTPPAIVGDTTIDRSNSYVYVGTDSGTVYSVSIPLP